MIPETLLREIQGRLDIVEVIGGYISLKKAGRNFKALCPFHPEKTPSFMIYPQKQFFICYGCGAGGDLITFLMRHEHLEFPEAVQALAQKAGMAIPVSSGGSSSKKAHVDLYQAHEVATQFYKTLLATSPEAEAARLYLKKREVDPAVWEEFSLGYAPNRWDGFVSHARGQNLSPPLLEKAGLAVRREGAEGWYDRFRHRIIFPIWDARGKVIAFGGRALDDGTPKYLNSPETDLYVKGRVLYGLHLAAPHIREKDFCIVVEGYMDMISPYQHGIRNVVASMGTSLTPGQVQLIRRMTRHVVMVYDGDYAGEMATLRGLDLFLEAEMRVKVAGLPVGLDPDSLIKNRGVQALAQAIQNSEDLFDYKLNLLKRRFDPKQVEGRIRICEEMLPTIKKVPNAIQRGEYVKRLSELLGVNEELLWAELGRVKLGLSSWQPAVAWEPLARAAMTAEDLLAGLLLEEPTWIQRLNNRLGVEDLKDPSVQQLVSWLTEKWQQGTLPGDHRELVNSFPRDSGDWENRLAQWLAWADTIAEKDRAFEEVLERIRNGQRRDSIDTLRVSIRQAEESGDEVMATQLIFELNHLIKSNTSKQQEES